MGARPLPLPPASPLLPKTTEYALRALAELAMLPGSAGMRSVDLAERTGVPEAYLAKILHRLVACGLLQGRKGHHGGFRLARAPERIRFYDVLRALDSLPSPNQCAFGWARCSSAKPCPLHGAWSELNETFLEWARTTTLADIAQPEAHRRA
jgi:Rrf2 family cysteine metabolism transcriptional repressor